MTKYLDMIALHGRTAMSIGVFVILELLMGGQQARAQRPSIADLLSEIDSLNSQVQELQSNTALELNGVVTVDQSIPLKPTVVFTGVNVQIVNGNDLTQHINGLGNLLIGYDEDRLIFDPGQAVCSDGRFLDEPSCLANGATWAASHKTGSHNLVVGRGHNYSNYGGVVFGFRNTINGVEAVVTGGQLNTSTGYQSSVSGGGGNLAMNSADTVAGGSGNVASGGGSTVSGGGSNTASGSGSSISGGRDNTASGYNAVVSGGRGSLASGNFSAVSGGYANSAAGGFAAVSGGVLNVASADVSVVSGGENNEAAGNTSTVSGGRLRSVTGNYDWAAGDLLQDD